MEKGGGGGVYTVGGREPKTERKEDNLDEEEELAEAGQQGQKAPKDTVIHIPKLREKHTDDVGSGKKDRGRRRIIASGDERRETEVSR